MPVDAWYFHAEVVLLVRSEMSPPRTDVGEGQKQQPDEDVGAVKAGEAEEIRENWEPQYDGPKVPFAGTMVDSELLKGAGLFETAEKALQEMDSARKD